MLELSLRSLFLILFCVGNLIAQEQKLDAPYLISAPEYDPAAVSPPTPELTPSPPRTTVQILGWNFSTIGISRTEYDRLAQVLADADISVLQEVEFFKGTGESSLTSISKLLSRHMNERICIGWFKSQTGDRARTAFIWRNERVSFVEKGGEVQDNCTDAPVVMRIEGKKLDPHQLYTATFFFKPKKQMFTIASIHWESKPKKDAEKEVTKVFGKLENQPFPLILAGDFKMKGSDKAFQGAGKFEFKTALPKGADRNLWFKNMSMVRSGIVDFKERFPELEDKERDAIASREPIGIEISFSKAEADALKFELTKKNPLRGAASVKPPRTVKLKKLKKDLKPLDTNDDLEGEAALSEKH